MLLLNEIKLILKKYSNIHIPNYESDIFIFSTPRSGTTLLMELICTQKGMKFCAEPLNVRKSSVRKTMGINGWADLLPNPEREPKLKEYFEKIKKNKVPFLNPNPRRKNYRFLTDRMVFKIIHGGEDLINWFERTFDAQIVYLVRHPIAVALSREEYPRLLFFLENKTYKAFFNSEQIALAQTIIDSGSGFEKGIVSWCLRNFPPLKRLDRSKWVTLCYEELVLNPESAIMYLAKHLNLCEPQKMIERNNRPSSTVYKSDQETKDFFQKSSVRDNRSWLISKWQSKVTELQKKVAFNILEKFEMDVYNFHDVVPSKDYLLFPSNYYSEGVPSESNS